MAKAKASFNLEALPTPPPLTQTLPSDALKMILLGAPLNEVLTTITRLIEAHGVGMLCSIFLLDVWCENALPNPRTTAGRAPATC
jgi:hypothetical protein